MMEIASYMLLTTAWLLRCPAGVDPISRRTIVPPLAARLSPKHGRVKPAGLKTFQHNLPNGPIGFNMRMSAL
jgi:hypothetical protein